MTIATAKVVIASRTGPGTTPIAERKKECALAAIEVPAGLGAQRRGAPCESLRGRRVPLLRFRRRTDHDGEVVEQPVRPGEFEESIDEDDDETHHLHFPQLRARLGA